MTDYLLDTNILIRRLRRRATVVDLNRLLPDLGAAYISVITRAEIMAGMHSNEANDTLEILGSFMTIAIDEEIADQAGRWMYQYARRGIQLALGDALIAATAFHLELTLITANQRHFPMPELSVRSIV